MPCLVFDGAEGTGIDIEYRSDEGVSFTLAMTDEAAYQLIKSIQNKLNARYQHGTEKA